MFIKAAPDKKGIGKWVTMVDYPVSPFCSRAWTAWGSEKAQIQPRLAECARVSLAGSLLGLGDRTHILAVGVLLMGPMR